MLIMCMYGLSFETSSIIQRYKKKASTSFAKRFLSMTGIFFKHEMIQQVPWCEAKIYKDQISNKIAIQIIWHWKILKLCKTVQCSYVMFTVKRCFTMLLWMFYVHKFHYRSIVLEYWQKSCNTRIFLWKCVTNDIKKDD